MNEDIIAKRYGDAFLEFASETIGSEKAQEELRGIKNILRDSPDFKEFLESPEITGKEKFDVIDKTLKQDFSEELRDFLKLLIDKDRIENLVDIAEYARIAYAHGIEVDALLKVSYPLDTDVIQRIKDALQKKVQKKLHLYIELDPSLLGGVSAKIGNIVIDGSVRRRLEDLEEKLLALRIA